MLSQGKEPRIYIVQRMGISRGKGIFFRLLAVLAALCTGGIFLWVLGYPAIRVYQTMISGSFGSAMSFKEMIKLAIPLCITSLGVTLAFKMKFWNIGAQGQMGAGAIAASFFAYQFSYWPSGILLPAMLISGIIVAGLWGMIPAYFKTKFGTNETLFTLMMNYIVINFIQFLQEGPWKDPTALGFPIMPRFEKSARVPMVFGIHIGWIFALVLTIAVFIYLKGTKQGYELSVVGENIVTAQYAGMPVKKIVLRTMFLSAGICGLAGVLQASGADKMLTTTIGDSAGFPSVTIAWLAQLAPFAILIVSLLFGVLEKGCRTIESTYKISPAVADVFQGIILFFVLGSEFFIRYKISFRKNNRGGMKK